MINKVGDTRGMGIVLKKKKENKSFMKKEHKGKASTKVGMLVPVSLVHFLVACCSPQQCYLGDDCRSPRWSCFLLFFIKKGRALIDLPHASIRNICRHWIQQAVRLTAQLDCGALRAFYSYHECSSECGKSECEI